MKFEARYLEFCGRRPIPDVEGLHRIGFAQTKTLHRTMRHIQQRCEIGIIPIAEQQSIARNQPNEMFERGVDRFEAVKNIRMIEFDIVDDRDFWQVMNELAPLIEESRIVLIAFNDEPLALGEPRALTEVVWDAAN